MSDVRTAQAQQPAPSGRNSQAHPAENLTLEETLRVMDVARELRDRRQTAEEMFRRDEVRQKLREKLMKTARLSGDNLTEAELDTAIQQYMDRLHTYQDPAPGMNRFLAHLWVRRQQVAWTLATIAAAAGGLWFWFG
ncbi:DUF6384 family protein [Crateriforma conspicua]|uniref:Uncharacterized protein n=1 Tax=Crateriforma conspicua TaxID=2527996 RepID=A0A5C5Y0W0_9PLAN|nr:DUF6384 family protein [Crateriforma conspicua]QDV62937.1 hypothetical protein Mal65_20740 [Crateriforma conspicua]TWT68291.1 hypothetical protein Pan14r_05350 [Crateriforma conspicua]